MQREHNDLRPSYMIHNMIQITNTYYIHHSQSIGREAPRAERRDTPYPNDESRGGTALRAARASMRLLHHDSLAHT
jgi:hypothetical protein